MSAAIAGYQRSRIRRCVPRRIAEALCGTRGAWTGERKRPRPELVLTKSANAAASYFASVTSERKFLEVLVVFTFAFTV